MKKIFSLFVALTAVFSLSAKTLYLQPSSEWKSDNARFAVYAFGAEEAEPVWASLTLVEGETGIFSAAVDDQFKKVIFCRMNPATEENNWDNKWTQTSDQEIPADKDMYVVSGWNEGAWAVFEPTPVDLNKFYVTGDSALVVDAGLEAAKAWDEKALPSEKDTLVLNLKANQEYLLKVVAAGAWKGYESLTDTAAGLAPVASLGGEQNISFKLKEAGEVKVIYTAELFKLEGDFFVEEPITYRLADGFYLISYSLDWDIEKVTDAQLFAANADKEGEFILKDVELAENDSLKVIKVEEDAIKAWYGVGEGGANNYVVDANHVGTHDIYFNATWQGDWNGHIWIGANPVVNVLEDGYYLIHDPWTIEGVKAEELFTKNEAAGEGVEEYMLTTTLVKDDKIKVVKVENDAIVKFYPEGTDNEYLITEALAGERTIYFRPENAPEDWGYCIHIDVDATAVENTEATVKAVKSIENGQLVIIKNGVKYNAVGAIVK